MKTRILGLLTLTLLQGCATLQTDPHEEPVSLANLVSTVQGTVDQINAGLGNAAATRVKEATIVLKTSAGKTKEGNLSLVPVSGKRQAENSATGSLTIQLSPSTKYRPSSAPTDANASSEIAGAVLSAVKDLSKGKEDQGQWKLSKYPLRSASTQRQRKAVVSKST